MRTSSPVDSSKATQGANLEAAPPARLPLGDTAPVNIDNLVRDPERNPPAKPLPNS